MNRSMYKSCQFCKQSLEIHHITLHQKLCYLNPNNLKKISTYFYSALTNTKLLRRNEFYSWAIKNKVLTSIRITARLGLNNWSETVIQLLIYCYLLDFLDFEYAEVLIYYITNGNMGMEKETFLSLTKEVLEEEHNFLQLDSSDFYDNYKSLYDAIINRAISDLRYEEGDLTENKDPVNLEEAIMFLLEVAPSKISEALVRGEVSNSAIRKYQLIKDTI